MAAQPPELIYKFDAHIQDHLAAKSDTQACGYQLGRGLAESFWALDPNVADGTPSPAAWWFLLGEARYQEAWMPRVSLVKSHPFLGRGGTLQVSEAMTP